MAKTKIIYKCKDELVVKYMHPRGKEYLSYETVITVEENTKTPVTIKLKFNGILPCAAPMPPEEHEIKAASIIDLYLKLNKWFNKYGYAIYGRSY